jgi:hypothetical protein
MRVSHAESLPYAVKHGNKASTPYPEAGYIHQVLGVETNALTHPFPRPFFARAWPGFFSCFAVASKAASIARGFASCRAW